MPRSWLLENLIHGEEVMTPQVSFFPSFFLFTTANIISAYYIFVNLPQSNPEIGEKDSISGVIPSVASSEVPLESIELSGEASVTRVQLPPSLQRELTKLLVKSQGPRPRPNLAAARSRLHAGEHHQAQVVESPDRMIQQLLMKLLDSPKSRDRQVQQIEELRRLLVQASKKGSERARFGVQQLPEISLEVLESLLRSGQLKPQFSEDELLGGIKSDQNHPKEQLRRSSLVNSPVNQLHPERDTQTVIKQEKVESEIHVKTEPPSPVPNKITIKSEPDLDAAVPSEFASSIQTVPSPPQAPSSTIQQVGGSGTDEIIQISDVRSLSYTPKSINLKEVLNPPTEADTPQQPVIPKASSHRLNSELVHSDPQASSKKVSQKTPRKKRTSSLDLKDILLGLSLKEERFHKRLITVESSLRTAKELISKKQKHVKKLKERKSKISQDVTAIRMKRLQLLKDATKSSLLSPASQKSLTKSCRGKCQRLTSQASRSRQRSSSGVTPVSGLVSSLTGGSSVSCPVNNPFKIHATSVPTNSNPVTDSTPTLLKVSFSGSSIQGKSQGPAGQTLFQGPMSSTNAVSGVKPVSKSPQSFAAGSSLQQEVNNPFKHQTTSTKSSLSRPRNNLFKNQAMSDACTNPSPVTNSTSTYNISFKESSNQDKSQGSAGGKLFQGPAGRTLFQGPLSSTPVSASGSSPGSGLLSSLTTGSSRKFLANNPFTIHTAGITTAGSSEKSDTTSDAVDKPQRVKVEPIEKSDISSDSVDKPQQVKVKVEPIEKSDISSDSVDKPQQVKVKVEPIEKNDTTSDSIDQPQQVKVKLEPIDAGYQGVGGDSVQADLVSLHETSLSEITQKTPNSLFGTSTSSDTPLVHGQSKVEKLIVGDISNKEQANQDHQATPGTKRWLCRSASATPVSKRARTTEGLKKESAKAKSSKTKVICRNPTRSAVSDTSTQEVPIVLKKSPRSTLVCEKWMPVLKLHKIKHKNTSCIGTTEKSLPVTTDEGNGSLATLDFSVFDISSDSDNSASVESTTTMRKDKSSTHIYPKLSALRTHLPSPQSAYERQSISEAKCGIFQAHCKAIHGLCNVKGRLCTVSADFTARVFNVEDFTCHKGFTGHHSSVNSATAWSYKDVDYLCTGSSDETVRIYNMQTFSCEKVIHCNSRVMCLLVRWETLYAGLANGCVAVINLKDYTTEIMHCKIDALIECMITASYKGAACLVIAYSDNTVGLHALADGKQHVYLKGHTGPVLCLGVLNNHIYSGSVDRKVIIHDIKTGLRTKTIKHHGSAVTDLIVGIPYLITASLDKKVRLFNAKNGSLGRIIAECPYMISSMIRIKKMLYVGYTTGFVEAIDVKPNSKTSLSSRVTKSPKNKQIMFHCKWSECGVLVKTSNGTKHLNKYHIKRKKEHKCKWGSCKVVINKDLPNVQELLWEHVRGHISPKSE